LADAQTVTELLLTDTVGLVFTINEIVFVPEQVPLEPVTV